MLLYEFCLWVKMWDPFSGLGVGIVQRGLAWGVVGDTRLGLLQHFFVLDKITKLIIIRLDTFSLRNLLQYC